MSFSCLFLSLFFQFLFHVFWGFLLSANIFIIDSFIMMKCHSFSLVIFFCFEVYFVWLAVHFYSGCFSMVYYFYQIWEVLSHYFLKWFFFSFLIPPSWTPINMSVVTCDGVSQVSESLFIFLHSFSFCYLRLDNLRWPIFKSLILPPAQISCCVLSVNFIFPLLYISSSEFLFESYLYIFFF